jgi:hypothetical protein
MCILPQVRCRRPPMRQYALPLNLTYIWLVPSTVIRQPALYNLLTFHNPNLMSISCSLGHLSKESVRVQGSCKLFITNLFFMVKGRQPHAQPPSWRTTPCRVPAAAYSIYLQLPSITESRSSIPCPRTLHAVVTGTHLTGDCAKICKKCVPNFGDTRTACCITTTHHPTLPLSPGNF